MRTLFTISTAALTVTAALSAIPAGAAAPPPHLEPQVENCCTVSQGYRDALAAALSSGHDVWGEQVMAEPNGPSFEAVKNFLIPQNGGGVASGDPGSGYQGSTDTGAYYLPFTMPDGDTSVVQASTDPTRQHYAFPLSDGGGVMADYHVPCDGEPGNVLPGFLARCPNFYETQFFVGSAGSERFGSAQERAPLPRLYQGYLPVLDVNYTDAQGVHYAEQTFAARIPQTTSLVAYTRLTARPSGDSGTETTLRVHVKDSPTGDFALDGNTLTSGAETYLAFSGQPQLQGTDLSWGLDLSHGAQTVRLAMLITPTTMTAPASVTTDRSYQAARARVAAYWKDKLAQGTSVSVSEPYVMDALRNMLIQNLIMGWRTSVGNGYEDGYVPEDTDAITNMAELGFTRDARANLQVLLDTTRGVNRYTSWADGTKLEGLARFVEMTGDTGFATANLPLVRDILADLAQRQQADPHGLLTPDACCEDNGAAAYWFHGQAVAWRGMADVLPLLDAIGEQGLADQYRPVVEDFGTSLRAAIDASAVRLPDGSLFIPERLLSGDQPYARITATREGSYWNLLVPYGLASGVLSPGQLTDALAYIHDHGGTLLGLTRFNWQGEPVGQCDPNNLPGYYGEGTDELYGWQYARALSNADEPDRLALMFYGKLAHATTRHTFISGEGSDIDACPWQFYRQTWWSPMSTSASVFLNAFRQLLLDESVNDSGQVAALTLTPATPRGWLADGKTISADALPTRLGPVSLRLHSDLSHDQVAGNLVLPPRAPSQRTVLRLRVPDNRVLEAVWVNGRPTSAYDPDTETIDLTGLPRHVHLVAHYIRD